MWQPQPSWTTNATKLVPPKQRLQLLNRDGLAKEADENIDRRLLLISAPAGYGKTSTLIQLYERLKALKRNVAWISLDADDNDIVRFLAHLVEAIARTGLSFRPRPDGLLGSRASSQHGLGSTPSAQTFKTELLNELAFLRADVYLFLDDLHLIRDPGVLDLISAVLLAPLDHVHFVVAARELPDLPIARLRAADAVHEIQSGSLAFSIDETSAFVQASGGPALSGSQVGTLRNRTEGWPASLQMALIAMRNADDLDCFLGSFSGADRSIADFLVAEVLKGQPEPVQEFLLATSILKRFNAGLANAVLERRDARAMIDHLETHNLFLFSLDRDRNWYRYHHLFAELLRKRIGETRPDLAARYHDRACEWLAVNGHTTEAIDHAFAVGDMPRAAELIDTASTGLFASAQTATLSTFAARLPPAILKTLPRLQLEIAWENVIRWRFDEARQALDEIQRHLSLQDSAAGNKLTDAETASLRMKLAHREVMMDVFTDRLDAALKSGRAWIAEYGMRDLFMSASINVAMMMCRREAFACEMTQAEWESLRAQFVEGRAIYGTVFLDTVVGETLFMTGDLRLAEQAMRQGLAGAVRMHGKGSSFAAMPGCQLALLQYEFNDLAAAQATVDELREVPIAFGLTDSMIGRHTVLCRVAALNGNTDEAHRALDSATQIADRHGLTRLHAHVAYERVRLLLAAGKLRDAERIAEDARYREGFAQTTPGSQADSTRLFYAMAAALLSAERGDTAGAIALLRRWLNHLRDRRCVRHSITLAIAVAKIQLRTGESLAARRSIIDALRWGSDGGFVRSFLDGGAEVKTLLQELQATEPGAEVCSADYLAKLLTAFGLTAPGAKAPAAPRSVEPEAGSALSTRELDVLRLTSKHLVAREIADNLGVAETTVKWYWRRIFAKLGVHRRAAAVRIAQQRGLIP